MSYNFRVDYVTKLVSLSNQFQDMKMPETAILLMNFPTLISKNTVKISSLEALFEEIIKTVENEFGKRDEHSKKCVQMILRHLQIIFTSPRYDEMLDELIEIMRKREPTANIWRGLLRSISHEKQNNKERFVGLSQEYASKIEGLYKIDLRICYLISKFAMNNKSSWKKIMNTNTSEIKNYYNEKFDDTSLFEGWNNHIRNAVAHSSYYYDDDNMTMTYEDSQVSWKKELSYNELLEMSQKLMNVCELADMLVRLIPLRKYSMIRDLERYKLLGIDVVCL